MNIILTNNIIIFNFYHYSNKSKKLECQEEMYMRVIKINEQEETLNVDDD